MDPDELETRLARATTLDEVRAIARERNAEACHYQALYEDSELVNDAAMAALQARRRPPRVIPSSTYVLS